ncbi:FFLEELY motif protein [Marinobacter profundi]|uniref:DUF8198 domain-containing protein n=1 Tax=Marinobacter profundi TaxID=2666256 RepID=A0A2G1UIH9_9GAMM|nr:hypothetical protein [Marinobacter profundi]PHQ14230.1 hypothetical protein CLH61_15065 [Marinobacter profundi]
MYRERLIATPVRSDSARRLQHQLLAYHDFRQHKATHPLLGDMGKVAEWQVQRLKMTHQDLYRHPDFHTGLEFLLTDLYAPAGMTQRDDNIDRVFPKMVKWLPEHLLDTFGGLVELNLVTQLLDLELTEALHRLGTSADNLTTDRYCEAFRAAGQQAQRERQIELVADVGQQLDRYVRNRTLGWLLSMTGTPAEMAGLSDLHSFLHRGYTAFRAMEDVDALLDRLITREKAVLTNILAGQQEPFRLPEHL